MATAYTNRGGKDGRTEVGMVVTSHSDITGTDAAIINGDTGGAGLTLATGVSFVGRWIEIAFDTAVVIDEAKWYQNTSSNAITGKWQGWDGAAWQDIGSAFVIGGTSPQTQTQLNGNTDAYTKYRIYGTAGTMDSTVLQEIEFKIDVISAVSYLNPLGSGDRSGTITVTGSLGLLNGTTSIFVDGAIATGFYFNTVTLDGNQWIDFDFGADYVMTEAKFKESGAVGQGTWHWEGKGDGGGSYVTTGLGSTFTLGGGGLTDDLAYTTTLTESASNTNAYRYYRLVSNSGSTSNGPWVFEMMFKIGTPPAAPAAGLTINEVLCDTIEGSAYASVDGVAV